MLNLFEPLCLGQDGGLVVRPPGGGGDGLQFLGDGVVVPHVLLVGSVVAVDELKQLESS